MNQLHLNGFHSMGSVYPDPTLKIWQFVPDADLTCDLMEMNDWEAADLIRLPSKRAPLSASASTIRQKSRSMQPPSSADWSGISTNKCAGVLTFISNPHGKK